ncbi:MAG TPA: glutaredoxin family protein [Thermodesulfovibrionales bacterium]|nr:glutaredoxin family protein [Thermodesulfovibrionales bacterium]
MQPPIKVYALSTCGACKATRNLLDKLSVGYECTEVDLLKGEEQNSVIEKVKAVNPGCSFPTVIIGDVVIVGFREEEIRKALGI